MEVCHLSADRNALGLNLIHYIKAKIKKLKLKLKIEIDTFSLEARNQIRFFFLSFSLPFLILTHFFGRQSFQLFSKKSFVCPQIHYALANNENKN